MKIIVARMSEQRVILLGLAAQIADNKSESPASPFRAFRKLFVQERRDWTLPFAPVIGWKVGELFEFLKELGSGGNWRSEWGDVGYYISQTWVWLWYLYATITPPQIIVTAISKFTLRANR